MQTLCAILVGIMVAASVYLILDRNLIRFVFGLVLASNAVNLLLFTTGRLQSRRPPLIPDQTTVIPAPVANALSQALILTAIVIGFALLSFVFILFYRAYQVLDTVDTELMQAAEGNTEHHSPHSSPASGESE
ncbi:MAG: Na+/H+ antiporter subunit C [Desulfobacterales bacterium]